MRAEASSRGRHGKHWLWLLVVPFIAVLWVPFYNRIEPSWLGYPFFYWYQLAWVLITAVLTAWVYFKTAPEDDTTGGQS